MFKSMLHTFDSIGLVFVIRQQFAYSVILDIFNMYVGNVPVLV